MRIAMTLLVAVLLSGCTFTLYSSQAGDEPRKFLSIGANDTMCFAGLNILGIATLGAFAWGALECGLSPEAGSRSAEPPPPLDPGLGGWSPTSGPVEWYAL